MQFKKSLGQHYLSDRNIAEKIVASLGEINDGFVLEIGPGTGALTRFLIKKYLSFLWIIEIDTDSAEYLHQRFPELKNRIIRDDFLKFKLKEKFDKPVSIIGNFPYNISSQIFFRILENRNQVKKVVCMIQKEVADRIRSGPGSKTYGILSIFIQTFYHVEYLFTVSEKVFIPAPKVKSAVIRFTRNERTELDCDESLFFNLVKTGFNQRRKTLRNSLKSILLNLEVDHIFMGYRPEQLNVEQFLELTRIIEEKRRQSNPSIC